MKNAVFWAVTPCGTYKNLCFGGTYVMLCAFCTSRRFGGTYRLHLQVVNDDKIMEALRSSET
jgi:hypothetical protein